MTVQEQLTEVNSAISAILKGGQSYTIGSRNMTRADLSKLYEMKNDLEAQLTKNDSDNLFPNTYRAMFEGR